MSTYLILMDLKQRVPQEAAERMDAASYLALALSWVRFAVLVNVCSHHNVRHLSPLDRDRDAAEWAHGDLHILGTEQTESRLHNGPWPTQYESILDAAGSPHLLRCLLFMVPEGRAFQGEYSVLHPPHPPTSMFIF